MPKGVYKHILCSEETKRKISISKKDIWSNSEYRKIHLTAEVKLKHSEDMKKHWSNPENRKKHIESLNTSEVKLKHSLSAKESWLRPEHKNNSILAKLKKSIHTKALWEDPEFRNKVVKSLNTPQARMKRSIHTKALWRDPKFLEKILKANSKTPTRPENKIIRLGIDKVRYTGNRSWWRKTKKQYRNPDFKVKGQNKVIEAFGDYWHRGEDPNEIIKEYKDAGLNCLVIWESEINNDIEGVSCKINEFINGVIL